MQLGGARGVIEVRDVVEAKIEELEAEGSKPRTRVQRVRRLDPIFVCSRLEVPKQRST
jgi:hypothetical protein